MYLISPSLNSLLPPNCFHNRRSASACLELFILIKCSCSNVKGNFGKKNISLRRCISRNISYFLTPSITISLLYTKKCYMFRPCLALIYCIIKILLSLMGENMTYFLKNIKLCQNLSVQKHNCFRGQGLQSMVNPDMQLRLTGTHAVRFPQT